MPALPTDAQECADITLRRLWHCGWLERGDHCAYDDQRGMMFILLNVDKPATIGNAITALASGITEVFDEQNTVDISLLGNSILANADALTVLGGANVAMLGNEIIQFKNAQQTGFGIYRLSGLLRGRLGTESAVSGHSVGECFVLLDDTVIPLVLPVSKQWPKPGHCVPSTNGDFLIYGHRVEPHTQRRDIEAVESGSATCHP